MIPPGSKQSLFNLIGCSAFWVYWVLISKLLFLYWLVLDFSQILFSANLLSVVLRRHLARLQFVASLFERLIIVIKLLGLSWLMFELRARHTHHLQLEQMGSYRHPKLTKTMSKVRMPVPSTCLFDLTSNRSMREANKK